MSSNAAPFLRFSTFPAGIAAFVGITSPVMAQDDGVSPGAGDAYAEVEEVAPEPERQRLDLSVTKPREESDRLLEEDCEEEADAARISNEIIVCRQLGEATDGSWNKEDWERRYAEKTKGPSTPNTFGIPNHGNPIGIGSVPPPALLIDVEALPEAPEGSDADRIARGLPPLGRDPEPSAEEIAERRRALGLNAPPVPSDPE